MLRISSVWRIRQIKFIGYSITWNKSGNKAKRELSQNLQIWFRLFLGWHGSITGYQFERKQYEEWE